MIATTCLLAVCGLGSDDPVLPPTVEEVRLEAGADLHRILATYAQGSGLLLGRGSQDALRQQRVTGPLVVPADDVAAVLGGLLRSAGFALWVEQHGPWAVLRASPLEDLGLGHARFAPPDELEALAARPALPVSTVLDLRTLDDALRARAFEPAPGVQVLRPGGGRVGWNGLVLWGPARGVAASARAFREGGAPRLAPLHPAAAGAGLERVQRTPTFGREDEVDHLRRGDEELAEMIRLGAGGRFHLAGQPVSLEELLRAFELATWHPITYRGGYAQRARHLAAPAFPRRTMTADELVHWVQAVLAMHGLVGQPLERGALRVEAMERFTPAPERSAGPEDPEALSRPAGANVARFVRFEMEVPRAIDLADRLEPALDGLAFGRCERREWGPGFYLLGPERAVANAAAVVRALEQNTLHGPAIVSVRLRGDAHARAAQLMLRLHPGRDTAELLALPWFDAPLVGAAGDEVLLLAHPDQVEVLAEEVRAR